MNHSVTTACLIALCLAACSEKPSLSPQAKAKFRAELVDERSECAHFKQKFAAPETDGKAIEQIYEAAKAAHCLRPEV